MAITRCYLRVNVFRVYSSSFLAIVKPDVQGESSAHLVGGILPSTKQKNLNSIFRGVNPKSICLGRIGEEDRLSSWILSCQREFF